MSGVRLRRLQSDYEAVRRLARVHPRIDVEGVSGNPPHKYVLAMHIRSLREVDDDISVAEHHRLEIVLPQTYPRDAPICRMLTPVFHPNIAPHAVCIGDHWTAGESLSTMILRVGEMLAFQSYNVKSPLNGRAARWAEENLNRLPIDKIEVFIDLAADVPAETTAVADQCSNCGARAGPFAHCRAGHHLCPDCAARCEQCGSLLCLSCGTVECQACSGPRCSNCGARASIGTRCAAGHTICDDCSATCESCGRTLCLVCGEIPCTECHPPSPQP